MNTLTFPCGASYESIESIDNKAGGRSGKRVRLAVYDSDSGCKSPTMPDGTAPSCLVNCPNQNNGRKYTKCYPSDETKKPPPYRYVVTCLATQEPS